MKTTKQREARENAGDQVLNRILFVSDRLRDWCEFSGPITVRRKAKPMQCRITLDTQLKNCSDRAVLYLD